MNFFNGVTYKIVNDLQNNYVMLIIIRLIGKEFF